jgi:hypothetical protein
MTSLFFIPKMTQPVELPTSTGCFLSTSLRKSENQAGGHADEGGVFLIGENDIE